MEEHFAEQDRADDRIDALHREIRNAVRNAAAGCSVRDGGGCGVVGAVFERFADQAVSVTRRLDYVVAGAMPGRPSG